LKGKWHFGATFINNEGNNVIGCIYLMTITGARGTDHLKDTKNIQFVGKLRFHLSTERKENNFVDQN
jgi:hypothetical protein